MIARIRQLFAVPVFENEHKTRIARLLHVVLLMTLVATVLGTAIVIPSEADGWLLDLVFGVSISSLLVGLLWLVRGGRVEIVGAFLSLLLWASITWLVFVGGGVNDASLTGYFLTIAIASLFLSARGAIFFGGLSIFATLVALVAEVSGAIVFTQNPTGIVDLVTLLTTMGVTTLLMRYAVHSMNRGLERALEKEHEQIKTNRELQAVRASLEQRVVERTLDLEQHSRRLCVAAEVGRVAASIRNLDDLLPRITTLTSKRFGFDHAGIFLVDELGENVTMWAASGKDGQQMLARGQSLDVGQEGVVGEAMRVREPRVAFSEIALPLIAGDRFLGILDLQGLEEAIFTQQDVAVFQVLADQIAVAIENANLFTQAQDALEAERLAYGQAVRRGWVQMVRARFGVRYLCNSQGVAPLEDKPDSPEMHQVLQDSQTVRSNGAEVFIPLKVRGQILGAIRLAKPDAASEWTNAEIELMETLTEQLGVALDSARLYQDTQISAARERLIGEAAARMRETLDVDAVLQVAAREIREKLGLLEVEVGLGTSGMFEGDEHIAL